MADPIMHQILSILKEIKTEQAQFIEELGKRDAALILGLERLFSGYRQHDAEWEALREELAKLSGQSGRLQEQDASLSKLALGQEELLAAQKELLAGQELRDAAITELAERQERRDTVIADLLERQASEPAAHGAADESLLSAFLEAQNARDESTAEFVRQQGERVIERARLQQEALERCGDDAAAMKTEISQLAVQVGMLAKTLAAVAVNAETLVHAANAAAAADAGMTQLVRQAVALGESTREALLRLGQAQTDSALYSGSRATPATSPLSGTAAAVAGAHAGDRAW